MNWKTIPPNLLTSANLLLGFSAVLLSLNGHISLAPWCIAIAAIFDFLDGFLARLLNVSGNFGHQLDALADLITFGVAPGVLLAGLFVAAPYASMLSTFGIDGTVSYGFDQWFQFLMSEPSTGAMFESMTPLQAGLPFIAFLIPLFSAFRLAKFVNDERQGDRFMGLPTPANALFFGAVILMGSYAFDGGNLWQQQIFEVMLRPINLSLIGVFFSFLLIIDWPLIALKFSSFTLKDNWERYLMLLATIGFLLTMSVWGVPFIIFLYLILSFVVEITRKKQL